VPNFVVPKMSSAPMLQSAFINLFFMLTISQVTWSPTWHMKKPSALQNLIFV